MKKSYLMLVFVIFSILSLGIGVKEMQLVEVLKANDAHVKILLLSRVPRWISIVVAGASMSISGLIMQQITRNKFVSPTTAATVDSARFGMLIALLFFGATSSLAKAFLSFVFALIGTYIFVYTLKKIKVKNAIFIPLIGMMLGSVIDSITTFFAYRFELVQNISSWLMGDFSMIIKGRYEFLYLSLPVTILAYIYANKFTLAGMGEDFAKNLGLNYDQVIQIGLAMVALMTAVVVITVGRIPFLGLIVPNIIALKRGDHLKKNIMETALLGAVFLLVSDVIGRLIIYPYEVPIGLVSGILGSVVFLSLLLRRKTA